MRVVVITPPEPVITWEEADAHLRLDGDDDQQEYVTSLIAAATAHIDGPAGWLGRALGLQTLEARFDAYETGTGGCEGMRLPFPPIVNVVSVSFLNHARETIVCDPQDYELIGQAVYPISSSAPWEGLLWRREALHIRYRAGYAVDPDTDPVVPNVPAPIKAAILLMVGDLYKFTETASDMNLSPIAIPMSTTVENMLAPYRMWA